MDPRAEIQGDQQFGLSDGSRDAVDNRHREARLDASRHAGAGGTGQDDGLDLGTRGEALRRRPKFLLERGWVRSSYDLLHLPHLPQSPVNVAEVFVTVSLDKMDAKIEVAEACTS